MVSIGNYVLLMGLIVGSVYCCRDGWKAFGKSCYHFSHDKETWINSVAVCKNLFGGYLVEINSLEESLFVASQASILNRTFWIGLDDLERDGQWVWAESKQPLTSTGFSDWAPGEPNNFVDGEEGCVAIYKPLNYHWVDAPCNWNEPHYICEQKGSPFLLNCIVHKATHPTRGVLV